MRRIAFFVEGQTEALFIENLVKDFAEDRRAVVKTIVMEGNRLRRLAIRIKAIDDNPEGDYYILIHDCGADNKVASDVRDGYDKLVEIGYTSLIALRDVKPKAREDATKIQVSMQKTFKTDPIVVLIILAVMEVEAWFLAEHTHFERIHADLSPTRIHQELGFHPEQDDMQLRDSPAEDLDRAYNLVGETYAKSRAVAQRTIDALDHKAIRDTLIKKLPPLRELVNGIVRFFTP